MPKSKGIQRPILPSRHPNEEELQAYARGQEVAFGTNLMEVHLLTCDQCLNRLREIDEAEGRLPS